MKRILIKQAFKIKHSFVLGEGYEYLGFIEERYVAYDHRYLFTNPKGEQRGFHWLIDCVAWVCRNKYGLDSRPYFYNYKDFDGKWECGACNSMMFHCKEKVS